MNRSGRRLDRAARGASRRGAKDLLDVLAELAAASGHGPLLDLARERALHRAIGAFLARRLVAWRLDGSRLVLEVAGEGAASAVRRLQQDVLDRVGKSPAFPRAPRSLRVIARPEPPPRRDRDARDVGAAPATRPPGPAARAALADIEEPELRDRLAHLAGWSEAEDATGR